MATVRYLRSSYIWIMSIQQSSLFSFSDGREENWGRLGITHRRFLETASDLTFRRKCALSFVYGLVSNKDIFHGGLLLVHKGYNSEDHCVLWGGEGEFASSSPPTQL